MSELTDAQVAQIVADFTERGIVPNNDQAMALVKKFDIQIEGISIDRNVYFFLDDEQFSSSESDLNRAICECCARMQLAKMQADK